MGSRQPTAALVMSAQNRQMRRELTELDHIPSSPKVLGPEDGDILGDPDTVLDRFMVETGESGGRFALIEHRLVPNALAAPMHLHTREDEFSFILEGKVGAYVDGTELVAHTGDLVAKPRGQWHTFWNAGNSTARVLEIISPAGLENLFRLLDTSPELYEPEKLIPLADHYGAKVDFDATLSIVESHRLSF